MFLLMIGVLRFAVFSSSFVGADIVYLSCVFRSITFSANFCKENRTSFQQTASSAACFSALIYAFFRPHQHFATFSVDAALFFIYIFSVDVKKPGKTAGLSRFQLVEKPAVAIKPEQVFCMKSKRTEKKEEDFLSILLVCGHPILDGWRSISRWLAFSDSWQQI